MVKIIIKVKKYILITKKKKKSKTKEYDKM